MVFYEKDRQILRSHHNRSLFDIAYIHDMELKRAMTDPDFKYHAFVNARGSKNSSKQNYWVADRGVRF